MIDICIHAGTELSAKIEAIIRKPGVADEDAPEDPASTRWWCNVGGKCTGRESMTVSMQANANIAPSGDVLGSMLADTGSNSGVLALTNGSSAAASASGHSLEDLVGVMNTQIAAKAKAKSKAKAKAKANPTPAVPSTPAELREHHRASM